MNLDAQMQIANLTYAVRHDPRVTKYQGLMINADDSVLVVDVQGSRYFETFEALESWLQEAPHETSTHPSIQQSTNPS